MTISSPAFAPGNPIPSKYTCDGDNVNPPLLIADAPDDAESLVLIIHDPDAPAKDWGHWLVWNINPRAKEIAEASIPTNSTEGMTDFGRPGYGGPCPPSGRHNYHFKLYALDTTLDLDETATRAELEEAMMGHTLAEAELIGTYERG